MPDGDSQGNGSSHAIAEEVRVLDLQLFQQRGGVIRHLLETQRPVDVVGMPMPLQLDRNHLMSLRQRREKGAPPFSEAERAVKQHERAPRTVNLIVHLEAVHLGVFAAGISARLVNVFIVSLPFIHFMVLSSSARRSCDSLIPASIPEL